MKSLAFSIYELNNGRFQASYVNPVTQKRKRHKFDKAKDAAQFKAQVERELHSKNYIFFMDTYVGQLIEQHLKDNPESKLNERANVFKSFYGEFSHYKMNQLTRQALKDWFDKIRVENDYSERTLSLIKSHINWLFRPMVDDGLLEVSPLSKIKFKRAVAPKRKRIVLSIDEVNQVLKDAETFSPNGLFPYLAAVAHTGARRAEILRLTREDVDFATNLIHIKRSKNGRERFVQMAPSLVRIIKNQIAVGQGPHIFLNDDGTQLGSKQELTRMMCKFKAFFPIGKDWGCHSLRHSFAYNFLKKSGHMYQLQAILGHRSIDVTVDLYGQLQAQDIACPSPYETEEK